MSVHKNHAKSLILGHTPPSLNLEFVYCSRRRCLNTTTMRELSSIVLHCSATPEGRHHDVEDIRDWHVNGRGWSDVGYHFVVLLDGTVEEGRPITRPGAHVRGHNHNTIGICYIGGCDLDMEPKDTMTYDQEIAVEELVCSLRDEYGDDLEFVGHNDFPGVRKACPSFKVSEKFDYLV